MLINLCIIQFDRSAKDPWVNRQKMLAWLQNPVRNADVVLLPEDWLGPLVVDSDFYLSVLGDLQRMLTGEVLLVAGAQYVRYPDKTISTGAFVSTGGIYYYDKLFPSRAIREREFIEPGRRLAVVRHRGLDMAATVCVDLFYPEITRRLAAAGARVIFNPASIPASRMGLWHSLGITRAAENTVFLAMANNTRTAYPDGREVNGGSFVAGPDGRLFFSAGAEPGAYHYKLDMNLVDRVRERWPYLADSRHLTPTGKQIAIEHYDPDTGRDRWEDD